MAVSLDWLNDVTPDLLKQVYGAEAFEQGAELAERGRAKHIVLSEDGARLRALVKGDRSGNFRTTIDIGPTGDTPTWETSCTCNNDPCPHGVALLLAARTDGVRTTGATSAAAAAPAPAADPLADWRGVMERILDVDHSTEDRPPLQMGLQFQRVAAPQTPGEYRLKVRPVYLTDDERWVPQGVAWIDLTRQGSNPAVRPSQLVVFRGIWDAYQLSSSKVAQRQQTGDGIHVEDLGPSMWRLLRSAGEAGITLLGHRDGPEEVHLSSSSGEVALDANTGDEGNLHVRAVLQAGDEVLRGRNIKLLGDPAHGAIVMDPSKQQAAPTLQLIEMRAPLSGPLFHLLATNRRLVIPADQAPEFLGQYGPALAERVSLLSTRESVQIPNVGDPQLNLAVSFSPTRHVATLRWTLSYPVGDHAVHVPLYGAGDVSGSDAAADNAVLRQFPRDDRAESELRAKAGELNLPRSAKFAEPAEDAEPAGPVGMPIPEATLSAADTALFVHEHLPVLLDHDDVRVEVAGTPPQFAAKPTVPEVTIRALSGDDAGDWFDLGVTITVDGHQVPLRDVIAAMATGDDALVLDSGVWFALSHPQLESIRRMVNESRELADEQAGAVHVNMFRPDLWAELVRDSDVEGEQTKWLRQMRGLANVETVPQPDPAPGLEATLRPYQNEGYRWLSFLWDYGLGGILADDMGLGKTMQSLAAICRQHARGELTEPVLIVAPTSVVATWSAEVRKFAPHLKSVSVTQTSAKRGESLESFIEGADIVITSYTLLRLDAPEYHDVSWGALIFDEAQFVKNHTSATYKVARDIRAGFKLAVTGTPLENSLMDLWSLLSLTAPGLFPDPAAFTSQFRKPIEAGRAPSRLATLRRRIKPFMLRRSKSQVATDLPPKQEQVMRVELTPAHRELYDKHLARERQRVMGLLDDMPKNRMAIFRSLTLLRQLALDPSLVDSSYPRVDDGSKLGAFIDHMRELIAEGHRALVFSQFTGYLAVMRERLDAEGIKYAYLDGSTRDRESAIAGFTEEYETPVFLISLKAGGFGLTLTQADYVFVMDPWWNPAAEAQAIDRAHRIGQDKHVMVYRMMAEHTIEEKVLALQERKRALFEQVVDDSAMLSNVLSAEDVRDLFEAPSAEELPQGTEDETPKAAAAAESGGFLDD